MLKGQWRLDFHIQNCLFHLKSVSISTWCTFWATYVLLQLSCVTLIVTIIIKPSGNKKHFLTNDTLLAFKRERFSSDCLCLTSQLIERYTHLMICILCSLPYGIALLRRNKIFYVGKGNEMTQPFDASNWWYQTF